jgi:hypothetical protein
MRFAAEPSADPNIEDTLLAASIEGMEHDDLRVLAILCTWLGAHHSWINADRLVRIVATDRTPAPTQRRRRAFSRNGSSCAFQRLERQTAEFGQADNS